ncbi:MAG: prephenate dehydrogenase/arogenate dehydrogenase family protein [Clostridia bacterium]|nr:prephenate dehydrogenase/arogenate dehydrogenase family protein [Clostridia bacterium]
MKVGIIGLGLIGGSLAKAYQQSGVAEVWGYDTDESIREFAKISGAINGILSKEIMSTCDLVLLAISPKATVSFIRKYAQFFGDKPMVVDCAGTKRVVCEGVFPLSEKYGFTFIGGHPMAGSHLSGFRNSRSNLFKGAPMVLVPPRFDDILLLDKAKKLLSPAGFGSFSVCTAEAHDRTIAFTSQLAHVVSNAYVQSPNAAKHKGFSAGSYQDLTRVAWLNPDMWTELFLENSDNMLIELDSIIGILQKFRDGIAAGDAEGVRALLDYGRKRKEEIDGK